MAIGVGIAGGVNSGATTECGHLQAGVVGKAVEAVVAINVARLYERIAFEGVSGFGNIGVAMDVSQTEQFDMVAQDGAYFFEFVSVVSGKNEAFHILFL